MNSKERIQEFKDYLSGSEGTLINVECKRVFKYGKHEAQKIKLDTPIMKVYNLTGILKRIKGNSIIIIMNGDKTLAIGLRIVTYVYKQYSVDPLGW